MTKNTDFFNKLSYVNFDLGCIMKNPDLYSIDRLSVKKIHGLLNPFLPNPLYHSNIKTV